MDKILSSTLSQLRGSLLFSILFLLVASTILVSVNFFTIKVNASIRAYIHGESMYSKGQKDAARHLTAFVYTSDTLKIKLFKDAIAIPKGDGLARVSMENNEPDDITATHLLQGNNHPDDVGNLIWLFKNFIDLPFMQRAYYSWHQADTLILKLDKLAEQIFAAKRNHEISASEMKFYLQQIADLNNKLTIQQLDFSYTLGEAGRRAEKYLFFFNFVVILIMLATTIFTMYGLVKRLVIQNVNLKISNQELDKFVYSASHDLRAPISSLKGLVTILRAENNPIEVERYVEMMKEILDRQDLFLRDIIDFSKSKRLDTQKVLIHSHELIDQVISNHKFMIGANTISFERSISLEKFEGDEIRLRIILNNLISNAVKYHDPSKERQFIKIAIFKSQNNTVIEVSDNGIGIKEEFKDRIFDMFFVTQSKNKGSGLGLYIVANALEKIDGSIAVESEWTKGSLFRLVFPYTFSAKSNATSIEDTVLRDVDIS